MGSINIDNTGSGSDVTLSSDGTSLLLDGSAVGGGGGGTISVDTKTASYTVVSGDVGKLISFSGGAYTASLTAASTLGNGFFVYIENNAANGQNTHTVTIDPDGSEAIDGRSSIILRQGQRILIVCDGSGWKTVADFNRAIATNARTDFFNLPQATGDESVAIGLGSIASASNTTAIGLNTKATGAYATSFGMSSEATNFAAVAAGYNARAYGDSAIVLGTSYASGADSLAAAIANNTSSYGAQGANSIAMGYLSKASNSSSVAIGRDAATTADYEIALGGTNNFTTISGAYSLPNTDGTSGQVLSTDGAGSVSWATAGGGAWNLIQTTEVTTSVSSIEFTGLSGYTQYVLLLDLSTDYSNVTMRFGIDGTYDSGSNYRNLSNSTGDSEFNINTSAYKYGAYGYVLITDLERSSTSNYRRTAFEQAINAFGSSNNSRVENYGGYWGQQNNNSIQLLGSFVNGSVSLYGVTK